MSEELVNEGAAGDAALLELGVILGQNHAFGLIAGRCSAAQAESIRRLREEKLYKRCCEKWEAFCPKYLKISRAEADKTIKLWGGIRPHLFRAFSTDARLAGNLSRHCARYRRGRAAL